MSKDSWGVLYVEKNTEDRVVIRKAKNRLNDGDEIMLPPYTLMRVDKATYKANRAGKKYTEPK